MRAYPRLQARTAAILAIAAIVGLIAAACSGSAAPTVQGDAAGGSGTRAAAPAPGQPSAAAESDQSTGGVNQASVEQSGPLIIKTGTFALQVPDLDLALTNASTRIGAMGGYTSGSQRIGDGEKASAQVTYRIPAARWDDALAALRGLADKVLSEESQTQDVTGQVLDLGARITNLQATEKALQGIMTRATKIADVLAVQGQLTDVRGQIEQLETQRKHLQEQAAFSTLAVDYSLKPSPALAQTQQQFDPADEVDRASASLIDVLQGVATAGIWFGIVWLPILLALAIVGVVAWVVVRRLRRSTGGPGPIAPVASA